MKLIKTILLFFAFTLIAKAQTNVDTQWKNQIKPIFQGLNKTKVPNGILLDYAMDFTNVPLYNGIITDTTYVDANILGNIYKTLFMAKVTSDTLFFPRIEAAAFDWANHRKTYNPDNNKNTIVLAGLYYKYAKLNPNALATNKITVSNNKYYDKYINGIWQNPYQTKQTVAFAAPIKVYNKHSFSVVLPNNLLWSNSANTIQSIQINCNDGSGYQLLTFDQKTNVNYNTNGIYTWLFKVTLTNGSILYAQTKIKIDAPVVNTQKTDYANNVYIASSQGGSGAILRIDYADSHNGQLTKPFIVAEGFDPNSILKPEVEGGSISLHGDNGFIGSVQNTANLRGLLLLDDTQEYDIIYIDWENGTNSIQHNSDVLKNILAWVNTNKAGTEPNVLLGQSMGGVIGRYTLAKMEAEGTDHEVRLFVAHDSPMQGANTPIGLQYFSRHALDQYTSSPQLYGLVEIVIPTILSMIDLMDIHNIINDAQLSIPSPSDYLTLQDTPAAMQMNYYYVDMNSNPTTLFHDAWQQEFEGVGYPTQCKNIAISNGNECAVNHGFAPRAKFVDLHDTHDPSFWGDLLHLYISPAIGAALNDVELHFLGQLPGESIYYFDFDIYANPNVNQSERQVYHGKLSYEKKLFWIIPITYTITERSKDAPYGYLPFDTYSGGSINLTSGMDNDDLRRFPSGTFVNPRYGFVPVVSALDIKRDNGQVIPDDYLKNYAGGNTPELALTTSFNNFIVDFNAFTRINNAHISFQPRNGNWLAAELEEAPDLIADCSAFCANNKIDGVDSFCDTEIYTVTSTATTVDWTITDPNNLVSSTENNNEITINQLGSNSNGYITLNVTYSNFGCGEATISKENIWIGKPNVPNRTVSGGQSNVGINGYSQLRVDWAEGNTHFYWWIYTVNSSCNGTLPANKHKPKFYGSNTDTYTSTSNYDRSVDIDWGNCTGTYVVNCIAVNDCGSSAVGHKIVTVSDGSGGGGSGGNPCNKNYYMSKVNTGANHYKIRQEDPCDPNNSDLEDIHNAQLYNAYGVPEQGITHQGNNIELNNVQSGTIKIIRVVVDDEVIIKRIITD